MTGDEKVYREAMKCVDDLVQEVFRRCDEVAEENHFEPDWILDAFREKFNRAKRNRT